MGAGAGHSHPIWLPLAMRYAGPRLLQCLVVTHTVIDRVLRSFTVKMLQREWLLWLFYGHLAIVYWMLSLYLMTESPVTPDQQLDLTMAHAVSASSKLHVLPPPQAGGGAPQLRVTTSFRAAGIANTVGRLAVTAAPALEAVPRRRQQVPGLVEQDANELAFEKHTPAPQDADALDAVDEADAEVEAPAKVGGEEEEDAPGWKDATAKAPLAEADEGNAEAMDEAVPDTDARAGKIQEFEEADVPIDGGDDG